MKLIQLTQLTHIEFTIEKLNKYLSEGGSANDVIDGKPMLHLYSGNIECMEALLSAGANPHAVDSQGLNVLANYLEKELQPLYYYGMSIEDKKKCYNENIEPIITILLKTGILPQNESLDTALLNNFYDLFQLIANCGVKPTTKTLTLAVNNIDSTVLDIILKELTVDEIDSTLEDIYKKLLSQEEELKNRKMPKVDPYNLLKAQIKEVQIENAKQKIADFISTYIEPSRQKKLLDNQVPPRSIKVVSKL